MPELTWIGKDKVINHHLDVPFRTLERQYSFDEKGEHKEDNGSANMIIHGDNLEALKALLPKYEGRVDCIYIDVPYNTGNEGWCYNDNVNDPKIKKWIGEVVGKDGEDLTRHDKWLCMMYPRLKLMRKLLSENGVLAISIGYQELSHLLLVCSEIFTQYQIMPITIQTSGGKPNGSFNLTNEYLIVIAPQDFSPNSLSSSVNTYSSPYHGMNLATFDKTQRPNQAYPIFVNCEGIIVGVGKSLAQRVEEGIFAGELKDFPYDYGESPEGTFAVWPITSKGDSCVWRLVPESLMSYWKDGYIKVVSQKATDKNKNRFSIQYLSEGIVKRILSGELSASKGSNPKIPTLEVIDYKTSGAKIPTIMIDKQYYTVHGGEDMRNIFGDKNAFSYPKPQKLIQDILRCITKKDSLVLDSFAGSGSTAHAILSLNKEDEGNRKFILVEMMDYAETITAERVKKVIKGYKYKPETVLMDKELSFEELLDGQDIYDNAIQIVEESKEKYGKIEKPKMANGHLIIKASSNKEEKQIGIPGSFSYYELGPTLFLENGSLNPEIDDVDIMEYVWYSETGRELKNTSDAYLGKHNNIGYYFFRNKTFNYKVLATIKDKAESYVVYAEKCAFSEEDLSKYNITFKKIPRDIRRV